MDHTGTVLVNPQEIFDKIKLAPGNRVADLGCGRTGQFIFLASKIVGEKGIVYGVDIIKDVLESVKKRAVGEGRLNIQAIWSDIEKVGKTPIPPASLNLCILTNVLFLVKDRLSVLKEAARLVAEGGYVVVIDWLKQLGPLGPTPEMMLKPENLKEMAEQANLTLVEEFSPNENHFCLIFKKK